MGLEIGSSCIPEPRWTYIFALIEKAAAVAENLREIQVPEM